MNNPPNRRTIDITGNKYGRLTVIEYFGYDSLNRSVWKCVCDCGTECVISSNNMRSGHTKSCGCFKAERMSSHRHDGTKHGLSRSITYSSWQAMRHRCNDKTNIGYSRYGGRGISYDKSWESFDVFLDDMGERPSRMHTLDRINNENCYSKENCKWSTYKEQARNTSANRIIEYNGNRYCVSHLAENLGIKQSVFRARLEKGWSVERCVKTPVRVCTKRR